MNDAQAWAVIVLLAGTLFELVRERHTDRKEFRSLLTDIGKDLAALRVDMAAIRQWTIDHDRSHS